MNSKTYSIVGRTGEILSVSASKVNLGSDGLIGLIVNFSTKANAPKKNRAIGIGKYGLYEFSTGLLIKSAYSKEELELSDENIALAKESLAKLIAKGVKIINDTY